jgi:calcium/calmodulin-dependent protein kinase I
VHLINLKQTTKKERQKKKEAVKIDDTYKLGKEIGRGAFSVVREGIRKVTGKKYAIKCISKKLIDKKELQLLEREIEIMKKLQHPNIIQLMEVVDSPDTLYLVLEYATGGELFDAIVNKGQYSEDDAAHIIKQILEAIRFVHSNGIAHRDLKPENLLLADPEKDIVKIADFGLSKDFGEEQLQTSCGTPDYVAPEVLLGEPYDMAVDIWSIGVITYVLLCGFPPFWGEAQKELFENIMSGNFDFPDPEWTDVSPEAKEFIKKILVVDPNKRYTAEECLEDPWVKMNTQPKKDLKRLQSFSHKKLKEYNDKYKTDKKPFAVPEGVDL